LLENSREFYEHFLKIVETSEKILKEDLKEKNEEKIEEHANRAREKMNEVMEKK